MDKKNTEFFETDEPTGSLPGHVQRVASRVVDAFGDQADISSFLIEMCKSSVTRQMVLDLLEQQESLKIMSSQADSMARSLAVMKDEIENMADQRNLLIRRLLDKSVRTRIDRSATRHDKKVAELAKGKRKSAEASVDTEQVEAVAQPLPGQLEQVSH